MTPREKILVGAIIFEMASIATKRHRLRQGSIEKAILDESHARLFTALKQADDTPSEEIKDEPLLKVGPEARKEANQFIQRMDSVASGDGPSEEDRHRLRIHESMHEKEVTKPHNCEFCWILSELKKAWE